jgi:K+-sensing histidine kinase KdpD
MTSEPSTVPSFPGGRSASSALERPGSLSRRLGPPRPRYEPLEPGQRLPVAWRRLGVACALAIALPAILAVAAVPLRDDHGPTVAVVLVVPVVAVALLGGTGPAVLAALSAGLAYDLLLTQPYNRLVIHDPDDVVATIVLVLVGLTVGVASGRLSRSKARATTRQAELRHLVRFLDTVRDDVGPDELSRAACEHITALLGLQTCQWSPGQRSSDIPLLLPDGNLLAAETALNADRAKLPGQLELAGMAGPGQLGRFVLTADPDRIVSYEERLVAAVIASLFTSALMAAR